MSLDLDAVAARAIKYAQAIGPGGEKAWLAGQLVADVPALLAEVGRLRDALGNALDWERLEREAAELVEAKASLGRFVRVAHRGRPQVQHSCGFKASEGEIASEDCPWCAGEHGAVWLPLFVQTPAPEVTGG